jgi:hypothetical protein
MVDLIIVAIVVGAAVAYLAWSFIPHRRRPIPPCAACTQHAPEKPVAPLRPPGSP